MKILLVYNYSPIEPLGVLFLSDYLERNNHQVDLMDYQALEKKKDFNFEDYDFVGFSILTGSHTQMFKIAERIRGRGKTKVVIGGAHTISFSEDCKNYADFVVRGFGEKIFLKIINGEIKEEGIYTESQLPQDLFISSREKFYQDEKRRNNPVKNVISSFCCPYRCTYCYNSIVQKEFPAYKYTNRPVDSVVNECKTLLKYPLKLIFFADDNFGVDLEWLREFVPKYKKEVGVSFHCLIRIESATEERIKLLKEAGCNSLTFAIEAASEKIRQELLKRYMTNEQILAGVAVLKKYNIPFRTGQMLGLPNTTIEDDLELLKFNCQIQPFVALTAIFSPIRGTPLAEFAVKEGLYDGQNDDIADNLFSHSVLNFPEKRKKQIAILNKVFTVLTHLPRGYEAGRELMESDCTIDDFYRITKSNLYDEMYQLDAESAKHSR